MNEIFDTWYAVVNPLAGSGKTLAQWREAESLLYAQGIKYRFVSPESKSDSAASIAKACTRGYRRFIAVGGDGTAHHLLNCIVRYVVTCREKNGDDSVKLEDFTIAVLPIGSGNDWIKSHNIPHDHKKIIELISSNSFSSQDVVKAEILDPVTHDVCKVAYMANIGGYAFDANVCDVVNFQKTHGVTGKLLYLNALKKLAFAQKTTSARIICDGVESFNGPVFTMSIGNGRYSGGGLRQTPSAIMNDGIMDIMLAPKFPIYKLFLNIKNLLNGDIEKVNFIKFFRCATLEIIPEGQGQLVELDGDIIGRAPVRMSFLEGRIRVLHLEPDHKA